MSTIDRASRARFRGSRGGAALAARAVRMRNACVRHAVARLGLPLPTDEDLRGLADDVRLRDAIDWWQARAGDAVAVTPPRPRGLVLRTALVTAVAVLGLALSYGRAQ